MSSQGPPLLGPSSALVTTTTASNVAESHRAQHDTRANMVTGYVIYPQRVITDAVEMRSPIGGDAIQVGTLAAISSTLGAVTVDANITLSSDATTRTIYFRTSSTNKISLGTNELSLSVGATASDHLYLKRGSTTVVTITGDSSLVTFAANITVGEGTTTIGGDLDINGTGTTTCDGDIELATDKAFKGIHQSKAGDTRANGTFTFYSAATSGGSPTQKHDITFADGLITGWVVT